MTREEIAAYLKEQAARPFVWGQTDCVQVAAGLIARATGQDRAIAYAYHDEAGAIALRDAAGGLQPLVEGELGPMQRDLLNCPDGAIVLTAFDAGQALGVALPPRFYVRTARGPMLPISLELAIGYWPCPSS